MQFTSILIATITLLSLSGCAQNPVSGRQEFVLMSEDQELALGRQTHTEILEQYPLYDNPALQQYVAAVGASLGEVSHRQELIYRFHVVDSEQINAFALPGGYIYITRGMLAYLNSEAELAAVLGHEIGHVTARHSVRQYTANQAANIGATIGAILLPELRSIGGRNAVGLLGGALLQGYGREHELEADRLGAQYLAADGYDPRAMIEVVRILKDQEGFEVARAKAEQREANVYHGVFSSHPDNDTRLQEVVEEATRVDSTAKTKRVNRSEYLQEIEGLVFGPGPRQGVLRENNFYHADLGVALRFPSGWRVENLPDRLITHAPNQAALLQVEMQDLNKKIAPSEFVQSRLKLNLQGGTQINGAKLPNYTGLVSLQTPYGQRQTRITVVYHQDRAYIFSAASKDDAHRKQFDSSFLNTALSLRDLNDEERRLADGLALKIITIEPGTTYEQLAEQSKLTNYPIQQLRLLNGHFPDQQPVAGQRLKIPQ